MHQTDNYQLSQWEKSDRILMDDFNGDNRKLDTAIRDCRPLLLRSWVMEEDATKVECDLTNITWTDYFAFIISIDFPSQCVFVIDVNGKGFNIRGSASADYMSYDQDSEFHRLIFPIFYRDDVNLTGICIGRLMSGGGSVLPLRELKTLTITQSWYCETIPTGTRIEIWGVK
jgi:hypothetical protein